MRKTRGVVSAFLAAIVSVSVFAVGCKANSKTEVTDLVDCGILHEQEFGGVYIKSTIEEFNALGFSYGDSVTVSFSNGYELADVPYYNGYYTKTGEPLLIAYPGYDYIKAAINNGDDLWDVAGLPSVTNEENDLFGQSANPEEEITATVSLYEKGKYLDIQSARDIRYFDDRTLYASDEVFANFRALKGGDLKEDLIYRSASPCDDQHGRAKYVDSLIEKAGVKYIIDLADNDAKISGYMNKEGFASDYFATLFDPADTEGDSVAALALNMNFGSDYFRGQFVKALVAIAENDGPFLIHCTEGKDRTGFVCAFIEAFAGATYAEIVEDYMMTYFNYYAITKAFDPNRYDVIVGSVLNPMLEVFTGENVDFASADLVALAESFLPDNGM
ncbi:MAG: tyrosine-protein phosphatase, partial [Clostridia bacterium]|nr:tyrosine-protein phosphatase [Clostridia bacterium]